MKDETILYPVVSARDWAKKYNISVRSNPCVNCGKILTPTKPFATGRWRGLTSEPHSCGEEFDLFVATKATAEERQEFIDYFYNLRDNLSTSLL